MSRLASIETVLAAVAAVVVAILKYVSIDSVIALPESVQGLPQYISTVVMIVVVMLMLLVAHRLVRLRTWVAVAAILIMTGVGVTLTLRLADKVALQGVTVDCRDVPAQLIMRPSNPSDELQTQIEIGGGIADGWCDHPDPAAFRELVTSEARSDVRTLTIWIVLIECLLGAALAYGCWLLAARTRD